MRDPERIDRIRTALRERRLDAVVCTLPMHVLLLTGYWPMIGASIAVATADGHLGLLVPEDELEVAGDAGTADDIEPFEAGSIESLRSTAHLAIEPLRRLCDRLGGPMRRVGFEAVDNVVPATYASMHVYGASTERVVRGAVGADAEVVGADEMLYALLAVKTPAEVARIRAACLIAERAFHLGSERLQGGMTEAEAAINFRIWLSTWRDNPLGSTRCDGFVFCMSGPNAAESYRTFQRTRDRVLRNGDLVVVHCNNYSQGYWTDVTRTYCVGEPPARERRMYDAVFDARAAALAAVRPGARAAHVYAAAEAVLDRHDFAGQVRRALGHGVGFHAINHNARPVLHPQSPEVLEAGMVFSLVPAIYLPGQCGMRHCDMVVVTAEGAEVLTPFQSNPYALQVLGGTGY